MSEKREVVQTCKWCRKEIIPGGAYGPWMHKVGVYTCPGHPETLAEPADNRWENVYASIGKPEIRAVDVETGYADYLEKMIEIRTDVWFEGEHCYQVTRLSRYEVESAYIDPIPYVLDQHVRLLDKAMDEHDMRRNRGEDF